NEALKKISEKMGNNKEPSRDGNVKDDNNKSRTGKAFATITNPVRKEYTANLLQNPLGNKPQPFPLPLKGQAGNLPLFEQN
nr:hypothetical protein [Tanacetum cinerariifolium]